MRDTKEIDITLENGEERPVKVYYSIDYTYGISGSSHYDNDSPNFVESDEPTMSIISINSDDNEMKELIKNDYQGVKEEIIEKLTL